MKKAAYITPETTVVAVALQQMIAYSVTPNSEDVKTSSESDTSPSIDTNRSRQDSFWDDEEDE